MNKEYIYRIHCQSMLKLKISKTAKGSAYRPPLLHEGPLVRRITRHVNSVPLVNCNWNFKWKMKITVTVIETEKVQQFTNRKIAVTDKLFDVHIWPYFAGNGTCSTRSGSVEFKIVYLLTIFLRLIHTTVLLPLLPNKLLAYCSEANSYTDLWAQLLDSASSKVSSSCCCGARLLSAPAS